MSCLVGTTLHFADQCPPFFPRTAVIVPVGARILSTMIEELDVVALERLDFGFYESIELGELVGDFLRKFEIHGASPVSDVLVELPALLERNPAIGMRAADTTV